MNIDPERQKRILSGLALPYQNYLQAQSQRKMQKSGGVPEEID